MTKVEFTLELLDKLQALPQAEVSERLQFYIESIDDRMEDGLSEEEAVAALGSIDEIASQIAVDIPLTRIAKEKLKRRLEVWQIILLVLGSPVWLPLLVCAFAVVFTLYLCLWVLIIALWAVFVSFGCCALAFTASGIILLCNNQPPAGIALICCGIFCAGAAIFLFFGCKAATKGAFALSKKPVRRIKRCFVKQEVTQ